jgi:hypothetical protein
LRFKVLYESACQKAPLSAFQKVLARKRRFPLSRKRLPESAAFRFPESNYAFQKAIRKALSAFPAREVLY